MDEKFSREEKQIFFEQYKLAAEMADRISTRREGANKIFLSANAIIFAFLSTQSTFSDIHIFISIFGIMLSVSSGPKEGMDPRHAAGRRDCAQRPLGVVYHRGPCGGS